MVDLLPPLPAGHAATRHALQRVATHVLARRRHALTGRIGLRASPGGLATPAAGDGPEVLRTDGDLLVVERGGTASLTPMTSLEALAGVAGIDLSAPFDAGPDAPPVGDPAASLGIDDRAARALAAWWGFATTVLDEMVAWLGPGASPSVVQVWPEHFDVACDVAWGPGEGERAGIGGSPGDGFHAEPYLYLGPWGPGRPGDAAYWNAPFGAVAGYAELRAADDPRAAAVAFLRRGLGALAPG